MQIAPLREKERESLAALQALDVLDTWPEPEFDAMVHAASQLCGVPISLISLIDEHRQWFKANVGLEGVTQTPRDLAFCAHVVLSDDFFEVPDATQDARFSDHPLVMGGPCLRFYAAVPLRLSSGLRIGTLCVIDRVPRQLDAAQRALLQQLANASVRALEGRRASRLLAEGQIRMQGVVDELAEQQALMQITLRSISDAVITTDADARVSWLNPVAEKMTGWLSSEARGLPLEQVFRILNEETRLPMANRVIDCLHQKKTPTETPRTALVSRHGSEFCIDRLVTPLQNRDGAVLGAVLVFHDLTEHKRLTGEVSYRDRHDALTGLVNRHEFEAHLHRVLLQPDAPQVEHALLFINLDQFKLVNDAVGHAAGDQVLCQVANLLQGTIRSTDTLARMGGDEFAVLMEHCTTAQARRVAQQICDGMDSARFVHDDHRFRVGVSLGLAPVDGRWPTTTALLQAADSACLAATDAGGNRVHVWSENDQATHANRHDMQWATRIEQALDENRFVLYAQRITALQSDSNDLHAEVLIRMLGSDGALIAPGAFIPAAERFNLASRIDRWVLKNAVDWLRALPSLSLVHNLSVNLSGQSVGDRSFHQWANELLTEAGPALCQCLCLEITETATVTNIADAADFIRQVRAAGVRVALDDFGAGAASFGYLKNLPIDYLKIDGQFIRNLLNDPLDAATVRCFADVAKVMGVKTVAEFVDQPAVLAKLSDMGIDFAQGFLLHKPAPIDDLIKQPCHVTSH